MKIAIQCLELLLTPEELKKRIPEEKRNALKGQGVLQAYTLAHEGTSRPVHQLKDATEQILKWPRAVIHRLAEKIKTGTKFLVGHGEGTNKHEGRKTVGEVLSSFVKEIGGRLATIVIGHFPDKAAVDPFDVCSMEADIHTEDDIVGDINEVTGIALGNSDKNSPAFPGALRLATVQCFGKEDPKPQGEKQMTLEEVKEAIRSMGISPWQIYGIDALKEDRAVAKIFDENSTLKAENERLSKANTEIEAKSKDAVRKNEIGESRARLDKLMTEGFTDKQRSFITDRFDPEKAEDLSDEGIKKYVEAGKEDFAKTAKLFGVEETPGGNKKLAGDTDETGSMEEQALKLIGAID